MQWPVLFEGFLTGMCNKKRLHSGDRSHEQLQALDALISSGLTYNNWQADVHAAERTHVTMPDSFNEFLVQIRKRQKMHTGVRSHEQLRALDALISSGLTYDGWQDDVGEAEHKHVKWPVLFEGFLTGMCNKQKMHAGDRSDVQLRALDALKATGLSYDGWQADVHEAEEKHRKMPGSFDEVLVQIRKRQRMHTGDRSHEQLRVLDALISSGLTYDGWQADVHEA